MARPVTHRILITGDGQPLRRCACPKQPCIYPMHRSSIATVFPTAQAARNMKRRMLRRVRKYFGMPGVALSTIHIIRVERTS